MSEDVQDGALVSISEIARLARVKPSAVSNWRNRNSDFPAASSRSARGDLYALADVLPWLMANGKIGQEHVLGTLLWNASNLTRGQGADKGLLACLLYLAARPFLRRTDKDMPDSSSEAVLPQIESAMDEWVLSEDLHLRLVPEPEELAALLPVFDMLESLTASNPPHALADALIEEYFRHLGKGAVGSTSPALQQLIAALVWRSRPGETVLDPACGTAGLLTATVAANPDGARAVYGADVSEAATVFARLRMGIHDLPGVVRQQNVLLDDPFLDLKVDAVVVDPPFGMPRLDMKIGPTLTATMGRAGYASSEWAWVFYAAEHLSANGRAVVLLPSSALTRGGGEAEARSEVLRRGLLEAVIALPGGLTRGTAIPLAAVVLRAPGSPDRAADVVMIDAAKMDWGWTHNPQAAASRLTEALRRAQRHDHVDELAGHMVSVPVLDALAPGASLAPAHWLSRVSDVDPAAVTHSLIEAVHVLRQAREHAEAAPQLRTATVRQGDIPEWATIEQLVDRGALRLHRGPNLKHSELLSDGVPVLTVTSVTQGHGQPAGFMDPTDERLSRTRLTEPGDVVFATIGAKAIVDAVGGHFPGGHLTVIEILDRHLMAPQVLASFLSTDAVAALAEGSTIQRVDLRRVPVPLLAPDHAAALEESVQALTAQSEAATAWARAAAEAKAIVVQAAGAGVHP